MIPVTIPCDALRANEDYQPRTGGLNECHIRLLMESTPAEWPPLTVTPNDAGGYDVVDGFHRLEAAKRLGLQSILCIVDPQAGYPEAVAANLRHGLPLSLEDRKEAARWWHEQVPGLSYREIGRRVGLSDKTVKAALHERSRATPSPGSPATPAGKLVRLVYRLYQSGECRTCFGLGRGGNVNAFKQEIALFDEEEQHDVAQALDAFGRACVAAAAPFLDT